MKIQRLRELNAGDWFVVSESIYICIESVPLGEDEIDCWSTIDRTVIRVSSDQAVIKIDVDLLDITTIGDDKPHYKQVAKPNEPEIQNTIIKENLGDVDYKKCIYAFNRNGIILRLICECVDYDDCYFFECQNKSPLDNNKTLFGDPRIAVENALIKAPFLVYEFNNEDGYSGEIEYNSWAFSQFLGDRDDPGLDILRKNIDERKEAISAAIAAGKTKMERPKPPDDAIDGPYSCLSELGRAIFYNERMRRKQSKASPKMPAVDNGLDVGSVESVEDRRHREIVAALSNMAVIANRLDNNIRRAASYTKAIFDNKT